MKRCREYRLYYLSFVLLSLLVAFHSNKVLAQSSPGSNDNLSLIPSDDLIDDDIVIIEKMINQQQEVEEPEEMETISPTNGDNDNNDSGSMAAAIVDNDNEIENDRNTF